MNILDLIFNRTLFYDFRQIEWTPQDPNIIVTLKFWHDEIFDI